MIFLILGAEPGSPGLRADSLPSGPPGKPVMPLNKPIISPVITHFWQSLCYKAKLQVLIDTWLTGKLIAGLLCCYAGGPHPIGRVDCWPWCPRGSACVVSHYAGWSMYVSYILQNEILRGLLTEMRVLKGEEIKRCPEYLVSWGQWLQPLTKSLSPNTLKCYGNDCIWQAATWERWQ